MILYEVLMLCSDINWFGNSSTFLRHLVCTLHPSTIRSLSLYHSSLLQYLNYEVFSFLKGFHDLGLGMNLWLRFTCFASLALQLFDWWHVEYIGTLIDSILSLRFKIYILAIMQHDLHLSLWRHKLICWYCVTRHLLITNAWHI